MFCNNIVLVNDVTKKFTCKPFGYILLFGNLFYCSFSLSFCISSEYNEKKSKSNNFDILANISVSSEYLFNSLYTFVLLHDRCLANQTILICCSSILFRISSPMCSMSIFV